MALLRCVHLRKSASYLNTRPSISSGTGIFNSCKIVGKISIILASSTSNFILDKKIPLVISGSRSSGRRSSSFYCPQGGLWESRPVMSARILDTHYCWQRSGLGQDSDQILYKPLPVYRHGVRAFGRFYRQSTLPVFL